MIEEVLPDAEQLARRAAEWLACVLSERSGPSAVALAGGSTPKRLYQLLAEPPLRDRIPWQYVHWFWGDERFVPPDDPRSNYRMVWDALLSRVEIPPGQIHPVPTVGLSPEQAAQRYHEELVAYHGSSELQPRNALFCVTLLGLGTNGHTASLFPQSPALEERNMWAEAVTPPGEPTRITLTYPALESSRYAAFLVAGAAKRAVYAGLRAGDPALPAACLFPRGELRAFVDRAAAA